MRYEMDQSIKIENINKPSYVCLANDDIFLISGWSSAEVLRYYEKINKK